MIFHTVLQQVGLPYQSDYHKSANLVVQVLSTTLYEEKADCAYHSNTLALTTNDYLVKPLVLNGTDKENDPAKIST